MNPNKLSKKEWVERILLALLFLITGSLIMVVFNPWDPPLERVPDYLGRVTLILLLVISTLVVRNSQRAHQYWPVVYGLLVLIVAVTLDWIMARFLVDSLGVRDRAPIGWALMKLNEGMVLIAVVVIFTRLTGGDLASIYIKKGNLKLGLTIGLSTFILAAAGSIPMATLFKARDLTLERILPWIPWLLIYVLVNAAMEEILFRGLFFRKLEPFFGKWISNIMVALIFTGIHGAATYTSDQMIFLAILFPLALAWGAIMQKTDAVWGSILFHAGMDIPIMLGIFSNL